MCPPIHRRKARFSAGRARREFAIVIAFGGVVFCTGEAWVLPMMNAWFPDAWRDWLMRQPANLRFLCCGGFALLVAAVVTGCLILTARKK